MFTSLRPVLVFGLTFLVVGQVVASAQPFLTSESPAGAQVAGSSLLRLAKKPAIDKSCLMICEQWGDNGCLKWVMKCKGDPGYPQVIHGGSKAIQ